MFIGQRRADCVLLSLFILGPYGTLGFGARTFGLSLQRAVLPSDVYHPGNREHTRAFSIGMPDEKSGVDGPSGALDSNVMRNEKGDDVDDDDELSVLKDICKDADDVDACVDSARSEAKSGDPGTTIYEVVDDDEVNVLKEICSDADDVDACVVDLESALQTSAELDATDESKGDETSVLEEFCSDSGDMEECVAELESAVEAVQEAKRKESSSADDDALIEAIGLTSEQAFIARRVAAEGAVKNKKRPKLKKSKSAEKLIGTIFKDEMSRLREQFSSLGENMPSSQLVDVDEDGDPVTDLDKFVFVDELACIGCTNCACIAPSTFLMEEEYGRARVYQQGTTDEGTIEEAIETCPVDCIHYLPWEELVALEAARKGMVLNFKARLVGQDGIRTSSAVYKRGAAAKNFDPLSLEVSTNRKSRCSGCPSNKCTACPMFGVGIPGELNELGAKHTCGGCPQNGCRNCPVAAQYPLYSVRRARRDRKRREYIKKRQEDSRNGGFKRSADL